MKRECIHCHGQFTPGLSREADFCSAGCRFAWEDEQDAKYEARMEERDDASEKMERRYDNEGEGDY
jgi:hypothetical protein